VRLLYVTSTLPCSKQETFLYPEIEELLRRGVDLTIVPHYPRGVVTLEAGRRLDGRSHVHPLIDGTVISRAALAALRRPVAAAGCLGRTLSSRLLITAKNLAVYPKGLWLAGVVREQRIDHIHVHWAATSATMAWIAADMAGVPWSVTAHRWDLVENNLLERKLERAKFIRVISRDSLSLLGEAGVSPSARTPVIHMGVDLPPRPPVLPAARRGDGRCVVACPANLLPVKGHRHLLRALAAVDPALGVELEIAGDGVEEPGLRALVAELGLGERVRFLGRVPQDRLHERYRSGEVDVVALASVDLGGGLREGIPVSLIEAMAFGIPVVGTATGGIPELLEGGAGLLVPPEDPPGMAAALTLLASDHSERQRFAERGRRRIEADYDVRASVDRLLAEIGGR